MLKKLTKIFILCLFTINTGAQVFTVGNTCCNYNLVNVTFTSSISLPTFNNRFGFDIDGDASNDIDIYSGGGWSGSAQVPSITRICVTSSTSCDVVFAPAVSGCYFTSTLANLTFGTPINSGLNWGPAVLGSWGNPSPDVYYHEYKGSTYNFTCGAQADPFYIGFRKVLPSNDTIYGWVKMNSNLPGIVYDYAYTCSSGTSAPTSTFVTSPSAMCIGDSLTLNASPSGGTFSGPGIIGNKFKSGSLSAGTYTVNYTAPNPGGCTTSSKLTLTVNPLPTISMFNWNYNLCSNDTLILNPYPIGAPFVYSGSGLTGNTFFAASAGSGTHTVSISLTDANGCTKISDVHINVSACVGINELGKQKNSFIIFPNPNNGEFEIKGTKEETIFISNELGQLISEKKLTQENNYSVKLNNLQSGVYFVGNKFSRQKIVVIK